MTRLTKEQFVAKIAGVIDCSFSVMPYVGTYFTYGKWENRDNACKRIQYTWSRRPFVTIQILDLHLTNPPTANQIKFVEGSAGVDTFPEAQCNEALSKLTYIGDGEQLLPPCGNYGDVNGDGYVTEDDAQLIREYLAGNTELTAEQLIRADVSNDGVVSLKDATLISQYVEGIRDTFPVCVAAELVGDITSMKVDSITLPEGETIPWAVNKACAIRVYFKNIGNASGSFYITVTDEDGIILCDITTDPVPADGVEYYVDCGMFVPSTIELKTLTARITP